MLMDMFDETLELRRQEENWIVRDRYTDDLCRIEEALDELISTQKVLNLSFKRLLSV